MTDPRKELSTFFGDEDDLIAEDDDDDLIVDDNKDDGISSPVLAQVDVSELSVASAVDAEEGVEEEEEEEL